MTRPLYTGVNAPDKCPPLAHRGLWFDRFFNGYESTWKVGDTGKKGWIDTVAGKTGDDAQLDNVKNGLIALIEKLDGEVCVMKLQWHFATGLGNPHPVENGFAWHHTLGVPYLTGAAVKGLVRAWLEGGWDDERANEKLHRWFGSEDKEPEECKDYATQIGSFIFFDALPITPVKLACDIMTPHMGKWYAEGDQIKNVLTEHGRIPADWHNPVPVPFLIAKDIKLMFAIAPRNASAQSELPQVMQALKSALEWLGTGAKTAIGYGRFEPDEKAQNEIVELKKRVKEKELLSELKEFPNRLDIEKLRKEIESRLRGGKIAVSDVIWNSHIKPFALSALASTEWSSEEKSALADMLEEWAGKLMRLDARDLRKQLHLNALRGKN